MSESQKHKFPNLIIPGAAKSGTTSLHSYLSLCPEILMSEVKEPHFFNYDEFYDYNIGYDSYFKFAWGRTNFDGYKYVGESSTEYFVSDRAIERMKNDLTDPKFIFILRDPIERVVSRYLSLRYQLKIQRKPFREEIIEDLNRPKEFECFYTIHFLPDDVKVNYIEHSLYCKRISKYIEAFGANSICIVTLENLQTATQETLNRCGDFLGVKIEIGKKLGAVHNETPKTYLEGRSKKIVRILRPFVPVGIRNLARAIPFLNERLKPEIVVKKSVETVTQEDKIWLKSFLIEDFKELKKLTGREFTEWPNFRDIE